MFFKKKNKEIVELAVTLYKLIVKQARIKEFYLNLKIPDTIDGRFELIVLHFFLLERTLDKEIKKDQLIYKELLEIMYKDFDMSLREIGVGDLSVGKKIEVNPQSKTIIIEPVCSQNTIKSHLDFLNQKFQSHNDDKNKKLLLQRIKSLSSKNFKIFLPDNILSNREFMNKINYYFRLMSNLNLELIRLEISTQEKIWLPKIYYNVARLKANSVKSIFNELDYLIEEA